MPIRDFLRLAAGVMAIVVMLSACNSNTTAEPAATEAAQTLEGDGIVVRNVQANMTLPSDTGSFWMEITNNGSEADALVGASAEGCAALELHDMFMDGDIMIMREVEGGQIPIPAGETVTLKQGGLHVMCIGKDAPLEAGTALDITLEFANTGAITVSSTVVHPGDMSMNQGNDDNHMGGE